MKTRIVSHVGHWILILFAPNVVPDKVTLQRRR